MEWEYEINMDESYADITDIDEWGCAQVWNSEKGCGAEYNYCIDNSTNEKINSSAFYMMYENNYDDCWTTYYSDYQHYEIDFSDGQWKEKLIAAMKQFVINHL